MDTRRSIGSSFVMLAALSGFGCAEAAPDAAETGGADLSTSGIPETCSRPVRSEDKQFFAIDLCPTGAGPGKVVRVEIATGTQTEVASYPAADRIAQLGTKGNVFFFATKHAVDDSGRATQGIDVTVRDWSLGLARTVRAEVPGRSDGTFGGLQTLMLTGDGSHVAFAADDGGLAGVLLVAPIMTEAAPVAVDVGATSGPLRWSTSGSTLVGHRSAANPWSGETLFVVETAGAKGPALVATQEVGWRSFAFGQGGTRPQEPFRDGRVLGFKQTESSGAVVGTVDPRTGAETELDRAPMLGIVTDLGPDVLYSRVTSTDGFARELVKQPRAGGAKTVLFRGTGASFDVLRYGFDPIAVSTTGAFGVFATRSGTGVEERFLVRLDGTAEAEMLPAKFVVRQQVGDLVLVEDGSAPAPSPPVYRLLDLVTGSRAELAKVKSGSVASLVGDGSLVQLEDCVTPTGGPGTRVRHTKGETTDTSACSWMPWANVPLAIPGSDAIVFYSSWGPFPDYRYDVGVVKP